MLATSAPIARLRELGARVHTTIGHDAAHGEMSYGVVLPGAVNLPAQYAHGVARSEVRRFEHRVIVKTPRVNYSWSADTRRVYISKAAEDAAFLLGRLADHIEHERRLDDDLMTLNVASHTSAILAVREVVSALGATIVSEQSTTDGYTTITIRKA